MCISVFSMLSKVDTDRKIILGCFYEIPDFYVLYLKDLCLRYTDKLLNPDDENEENIEFFSKLNENLSQMLKYERLHIKKKSKTLIF